MLYSPVRHSFVRYLVSLLFCTVFRLVPGRPPNLEPVLATVMPLSRAFGVLDSALFAALNIVVFDVITGKVGTWTIVTAVTYAFIAASGALFFSRYHGRLSYVLFAIIGTLFFDLVTGVIAGPILFGQNLREAFVGQIPFTLNHLLGNIVLALTLSPFLERWVIRNDWLHLPQSQRKTV